jgi:uracil-DNA glycosylase family 4
MTYDPRALGAKCHRCPLQSKTPIPPLYARDPLKPKLIIIGMNPGRLEENRGQPFIGPAGRMLTKCLEEAGFNREDAHITNAAQCRNDEDADLKRAVPCCAPRLANELTVFDPAIPILTLGSEALRPTLGKAGIMKARGFVWTAPEIKQSQVRNVERRVEKLQAHFAELKATLKAGVTREERIQRKKRLAIAKGKIEPARDSVAIMKARLVFGGRIILPSIHPAFILRGADGWLPVLRLDIARAVRWSKAPFPLEDEGSFVHTHNPKEARRLLAKMSDLVNVDIETDGKDPMTVGITCVGVADVNKIRGFLEGKTKTIPKSAIVVLDPWNRRLEPVLRDALKSRTVLTHNGPAFDEIALARHGIRYAKREDTLIAHYAFASDKPKSLAYVSSIYNHSIAWKTRFKQGSEEKGVAGFGVKKEDLAVYNRADVALASLAWLRMQPDLARERAVYEHDMKHALLCQKMQINGLLVDVDRKNALSKKLKFRSAALLGEMRSLLGRRNFSPSKPNDIRKALFTQLKAPTYLAAPTPTGLPATGAKVLEALRMGHNRAAVLADLIIRWRSANDSRSEYLDNLKVDTDGRVHPHWRSFGTVTGRPATREPNVLNITRGAYCKGCGAALLDAWGDRPAPKHGKLRNGGWVECKKKEEPQPEDQLRDIYVVPNGYTWVYFDLSQCFAPGTMIDTPTGPKSIETLKIGDLVFTYRNRRPAVGHITQSVKFLKRPVVKVTLDNGEQIRCTPDHKWLVCPERQDDDPVPRRADALRLGDRLLPFRKLKNPADGREMLYAHKAIEYSKTHIEVARTVLGPRPDGYDVHHKDDDRTNNDPSNLEYKLVFKHKSDHGRKIARRSWGTPSIRKKMVAGLRRAAAERDVSGENNSRWGDRRQRSQGICGYCKKPFEFFKTQSSGLYCSKSCYGAAKTKPRPPCAICRKIVRRPSMLFCGRRCEKVGLEQGLNHKVVSVESNGVSDVWSIAVDPDHNYALAAGVFVNNCEMRFAAFLSNDEEFIKSCDGDIHAANARILFAAVPGALTALEDPKGAGKQFRDIAKACGFAISYLAEAVKLLIHLLEHGFDIDMDVCQDAIDAIHAAYWRYYEWAYENIALCQRQGYLRTPFLGRKRWMGYHVKPTEVPPFLISGGVADVMNHRLGVIDARMPKGVKQVLYQYDSAIYETPMGLVPEMKALIKDVWAEPVKIPGGREFLQPIELKEGVRWSDFG